MTAEHVVRVDIHTPARRVVHTPPSALSGLSHFMSTTNNSTTRFMSSGSAALQVQTVTIAATHQDEVQIITTAAPAIVGVQLMSTSADEGETVAGNFALQFPERQLVRCRVHPTAPPRSVTLRFVSPTLCALISCSRNFFVFGSCGER